MQKIKTQRTFHFDGNLVPAYNEIMSFSLSKILLLLCSFFFLPTSMWPWEGPIALSAPPTSPAPAPVVANLLPNPSDDPILYTLKDLQILEAEKNYVEFFKHARDLRPSLRNQHWNDMLVHMAEMYISDRLKRKKLDESTYQLVEELFDWPTLNGNEFFLEKRSRFGEAYFAQCFSTQSDKKACLQKGLQFWTQRPDQPPLGLFLGKLLKDYLPEEHLQAQYWTFFQPAVKDAFSGLYCAKSIVQEASAQYFKELLNKPLSDEQLLGHIDTHFTADCWKVLQPEWVQALLDPNSLLQHHAYRLLKVKNALIPWQRDAYLTLFLLNNPIQGNIFNEAWNAIKNLSRDFPQRMQVLEFLQKLDPLPGPLLSSPNQQKKRVILQHLDTYFPEYLTYYARTCVEFYGGKKEFLHGNPTLYCKELFQERQQLSTITSSMTQELKKFLQL